MKDKKALLNQIKESVSKATPEAWENKHSKTHFYDNVSKKRLLI